MAHWPHVGSNYGGLVILGQALHGWPDDFEAHTLVDDAKRSQAMRLIRARNDGQEPMAWLDFIRERGSAFWSVARLVTDGLNPGTTPWWTRFAWVNLYPVAPERDNPSGWLKKAQDPYVADLLVAFMELLRVKTVVALVGPFWWPAGHSPHFAWRLADRDRPLMYSGSIDGRTWVVGWHPAGASRRGYRPPRYADVLVAEAQAVSGRSLSR